MAKGLCGIDHTALAGELEGTPLSQRAPGRHYCAGCAYLAGYAAGEARGMAHTAFTLEEARKLYDACETIASIVTRDRLKL